MVRILLVEGDNRFRQTLKEVLVTNFPFISVEEASTGKEAFEKIESFCPDLIFMDVRLPKENGIKLTRSIKNSYPGIPVVVLSTHDFPEYREAACQAGADYWAVKGMLTTREIEGLIRSMMAKVIASTQSA